MHSSALWLGLSGLVIIAVLMQRKIKVRARWLARTACLRTVMSLEYHMQLDCQRLDALAYTHDARSACLKTLQLTFRAHMASSDIC